MKIVDLASINFTDFALTCSIYSKMLINLILAGTIFSENGVMSLN